MKNAYNGQRYVKQVSLRVLSSVSKFVLNCFGMRSTSLKVTRSGRIINHFEKTKKVRLTKKEISDIADAANWANKKLLSVKLKGDEINKESIEEITLLARLSKFRVHPNLH